MKPLESPIEHKVEQFDEIRNKLGVFDFTLGGNWDYDHGYFDRSLDEAHKVFLRIPFHVTNGSADLDKEETGAIVRIGKPFILNHVYNEGLDPEAQVEPGGALVDQFQTPIDPDAQVDNEWIVKGTQVLRQVEKSWLQ